MKNKRFIASALVALIVSTGVAVAQGEPTLAKDSSREQQAAPGLSDGIATLTSITVHRQGEEVSVEISSSRPVTPTSTMIADPIRLVLDFPDTVSANLRNRISVNRDGLKSVRVGVQPMSPPATRVVLDLEQPRDYELVGKGNNIIVKLRPPDPSKTGDSALLSSLAPQSTLPDQGIAASAPVQNPTSGDAAVRDRAAADPPAETSTAAGESSAAVTGSNAPQHKSKPDELDTIAAGVPPVSAAMKPESSEEPDPEVHAGSADVSPKSPQVVPAKMEAGKADPKAEPAIQQRLNLATSTLPAEGNAAPATNSTTAPAPVVSGLPLTAAVAMPLPDVAHDVPAVKKAEVPPVTAEYVIGEQDVLTIVVWREKELSATVVVRPDGKITLPLLNEIRVVGMTPTQLQELLTDKLKPYLTVPAVTVVVNQINSRKVYLIGEVGRTGTFAINSSTTVLQLIAEAGGVRDFAKRKDIYVLRTSEGKQSRFRFNYDDVIRGKNTQQNIVLQPGDMVVVP